MALQQHLDCVLQFALKSLKGDYLVLSNKQMHEITIMHRTSLRCNRVVPCNADTPGVP